ncbi:MAG: LicD family protein [Paludibacteraceae bacterium]|nr:LicD family protein [Paludibacteraceae bacterium]
MRDLIIKIALKIGIYKRLVKIDTYFKEKRMAKNFLRYGKETLIQADNAIRSCNAKMILNFGTLLGFYRDGGFIPYDFDLDVCMLASERPDNLREIMSDFGFSLKRQFYEKATNIITEEQFVYKGVQIDFFYLYEKEHDWYAFSARRHETKDWKEANRTDGFPSVIWPCKKCNIIEKEYIGHTFFVPELEKDWLSGVYGEDFMTPVKNWTEKGRETRMIRNTNRLYRASL